MANIAFNQLPEGFQAWYDELVKYVADESSDQSFASVVKKWSEYCEEAAGENIFTGKAAEINFTKFKEVNDAFKKFFTEFGEELGQTGSKVQSTMNQMESEVAIGGTDIGSFTVPTVNISEVPDFTLTQEIIEYNTEAIRALADKIGKLNDDLDSTKGLIENHLGKLDSGEKIWDGQYAASYVDAVKTCLNNNIPKIEEDVTGVSDYMNNNIAQVAEDVDSTTVSAG